MLTSTNLDQLPTNELLVLLVLEVIKSYSENRTQ